MKLDAHRQLTRAEELKLARKAKRGDTKARHELVTRNLRLVIIAVKRFSGYGISRDDLISEGNVGLVRAVDRFDTKRGVRFATAAMHSIRSHLFRFVIENAKPLTLPSNERGRVFWRYGAARFRLGPDASEDEILEEMNGKSKHKTTKQHLNEMLPLLGNNTFYSLDAIDPDTDHMLGPRPMSPDPDPEDVVAEAEESAQEQDLVAKALCSLSERERYIVIRRFMLDDPVTLDRIGEKVGLTRERVRQIEIRALSRLRSAIGAITGRVA